MGCHGVAVFHVRHVDIDDAIQQGEGLGTVVAAGIVHQRQPEPLAGRDQRRFKNLRHHMTGADKINVMTALGLQIQHHGRQFLRCRLVSRPFLADLPVLAKLAAQIAAAEENRSRAVPAAQYVFFAVMGAVTVNDGVLSDPAYRALQGPQAIDPTIARAKIASLQMLAGDAGTPRQFAAFKQVQIGGVKAVIFMRWLRGRSCQIETLFYVGSQ